MMSLPTYEETPTLEMGAVLRHFWLPPSFPPLSRRCALHYFIFCTGSARTTSKLMCSDSGGARVGKVVPCIFFGKVFPSGAIMPRVLASDTGSTDGIEDEKDLLAVF